MSADIDQYNAESLEILLLKNSTALSAISTQIFHGDNASQASGNSGGSSIDRISVTAQPRTIKIPGLTAGSAKLYAVIVKVTLYLATNDASKMSQYAAGIEAANTNAGVPAGWVTTAQGFFPAGGPIIEETDDGDRTMEENQRTFSKSFEFIFNA